MNLLIWHEQTYSYKLLTGLYDRRNNHENQWKEFSVYTTEAQYIMHMHYDVYFAAADWKYLYDRSIDEWDAYTTEVYGSNFESREPRIPLRAAASEDTRGGYPLV